MTLPAPMFPFMPNWRDAYSITYEFKTDILASRSGKEQRRALRNTPRKTVAYTATLVLDDLRAFERTLIAQQQNQVTLPEITRGAVTRAVLHADGVTVSVGAIPVEFLAENAPALLVYRTQVYPVTIASTSTGSVTLLESTGQEWPRGTLICPMLLGRLGADMTGAGKSGQVAEASIVFAVNPGSETLEAPYPEMMLDGYPVFPLRPDWTQDVQINYQHPADFLDFGWGPTDTVVPITFGTTVRQFAFTARSRAEVARLRRFFVSMKGQRGEFWASSEQSDLVLAVDCLSGSATLTVQDATVEAAFANDLAHRAIVIVLADGTRYARSVINMDQADDTTVLTLEAAATADWKLDNVAQVSWLYRSRFASDQLVMQYVTDTVAQAQVAITTLPVYDDSTGAPALPLSLNAAPRDDSGRPFVDDSDAPSALT
jgi:hypothetical protein